MSEPERAPAPEETRAEQDAAFAAAFEAFRAALRESDPDLEGLEEPAAESALAAAEATLGLSLPPSFRAFLRAHNGGSAHDTSIYGVGDEEGYDLARLNLRGREEGLPEHLVGFAATLGGDVYCFDTSEGGEGGEHPVALLDVQQGQVIPACRTFLEWLERLPSLEDELHEQRGPQPMTVDEWEAFLVREREKLRKLSKTPARELTMPDPEAVRADLGGKIPVDPRHLKPR